MPIRHAAAAEASAAGLAFSASAMRYWSGPVVAGLWLMRAVNHH